MMVEAATELALLLALTNQNYTKRYNTYEMFETLQDFLSLIDSVSYMTQGTSVLAC